MRWIGILLGLIAESCCFSVRVAGPHYARLGSSVRFTCEHGVPEDLLHKVDWLKGGLKFFQYVKGRKPPFRNYSLSGAIIDWEGCTDRTVVLEKLTMAASGHYSCEVSTDTPIYTKASELHELVVIQNQIEEPRISFGRPVYTVGDWVKANCTSGKATPTPHVTWLINGRQADPSIVKVYQTDGKNGLAELRLQLGPEHMPGVVLTCLATIPAYPTDRYADRRAYTVSVEVIPVRTKPGSPKTEVQKSSASVIKGFSIVCLFLFSTFYHS